MCWKQWTAARPSAPEIPGKGVRARLQFGCWQGQGHDQGKGGCGGKGTSARGESVEPRGQGEGRREPRSATPCSMGRLDQKFCLPLLTVIFGCGKALPGR